MLSLSLFMKSMKSLTGYIGGQKSTSSGVPIHASKGVLLLAMQALMATLIEFFFFLITSIQLVEENWAYLGRRANKQVKIDERLVKDHLREVGATEISICKSSTALPMHGSGRSKGRWDALFH
jgi:hypothetical protein